MGFFNIFALELISNIPVWLGFMVAVKMLYDAKRPWWHSILVLYGSALVTAALVLVVEPVKLGESTMGALYLDQLVLMAAVFTIVGLPFLWYVATTRSWVSWRSDLILSAMLGLVLTAGEALVVEVFDPQTLIMHALSMAVAAGVTIPLMRWLKSQTWKVAVEGVLAVAIFASVLIVAIEYMPQQTAISSAESTAVVAE